MEIEFTNAKLAKLCNSESKLRGKYGPQLAESIQKRLGQLAAAETLDVMRGVSGNTHALSENLDGLIAISLIGKERLVFRPDHNPPPELPAGGLDWKGVTKIIVEGIGDYH